MPDYVKDPNNSKKQIPGSNPDNYYDRVKKPQGCTLQKTPNYVYINTLIVNIIGSFCIGYIVILLGNKNFDRFSLPWKENILFSWEPALSRLNSQWRVMML